MYNFYRKPFFTHDCNKCQFMGGVVIQRDTPKCFDVWQSCNGSSWLVRYDNQPEAYASLSSFGHLSPLVYHLTQEFVDLSDTVCRVPDYFEAFRAWAGNWMDEAMRGEH